MPKQECYLEYLWIAPEFRRAGVGSLLLRTVLDRLRDSGVRTVWLYILDGNDDALRLYKRFGFQNANGRQLLPYHPAGGEELMKLQLGLPGLAVALGRCALNQLTRAGDIVDDGWGDHRPGGHHRRGVRR